MKNIFKRIISIFCAISLALVPIPAQAQEGASIKVGTASAYAGSTAYIYVTGENFEKLAALDLDIYYDPEVLTLYSASASGISDATVELNTDTAGIIKLSMVSAKGISGELTLLSLRFTAKSDVQPGDYPIYAAVGDAYEKDT